MSETVGEMTEQTGRPGRVRVNTALRLYNAVFGLDELHYGLWDGDPFTLAGVRAAQERYSEELLGWIPDGVRSVLDSGCGTGSNCVRLLARGYRPEGLAPDPYLEEAFRRRLEVPFHLCRFQDLVTERTFDLVLMSESCQYVRLRALVPAVRRIAPGGHLLVSDVFTLGEHEHQHGGHELEAFRAELAQGGLEVLREEDVTDRAAVTLDCARHFVEHHLEPGIDVVRDKLAGDHPYLFRLGSWLLRKPLRRAGDMRAQLDSELFRRHHRYLRMLIRVPSS